MDDCGEAIPEATAGELSCRYDLTTETQAVAEDLVAVGVDDDLWAGNILRGIAARSGDLQSVPLPRGTRMLSTTLAGGAQVALVNPSNSSYGAAIAQLLEGQRQPTGSAVASHINTTSLFSRESLSKALGIDIGSSLLDALGVKLGLDVRSSVERSSARVAVSFLQSYYRVVADAPSTPAEFFAEGVQPADVLAALGEGDVPVYVRSVTYGRRVVAIFEDTSRSSDEGLKAELQTMFTADPSTASFGLEEPNGSQYTRFSALVLGDNRVFTDIDELRSYLGEPADITTACPSPTRSTTCRTIRHLQSGDPRNS